METKEKILFRDLFVWLFRRHLQMERGTLGAISRKQRDIYERIGVTWKRIENEDALRRRLNYDDGKLVGEDQTARYLYLEPIQKENAVPILWIAYDWRNSLPEISLRLGIFVFDKDKALKAIGYRFETPHGQGPHHFYHAQPIQEILLDKLPCPEWIPLHQPSFVIDAVDSITLLFSLIISLYGYDYVEHLARADFGNQLLNHVGARMVMLKSDYQPKYWRFVRQDGEWVCVTMYEDRKVKQILQIEYGGREFRTITREQWSAHDESKRMTL